MPFIIPSPKLNNFAYSLSLFDKSNKFSRAARNDPNEKNETVFKNKTSDAEDFLKDPSFSFVTLFLKFIYDDYIEYGDLKYFNSYFENKKNNNYISYMIDVNSIKTLILERKYLSGENYNKNKEISNAISILNKSFLKLDEEESKYTNNSEKMNEIYIKKNEIKQQRQDLLYKNNENILKFGEKSEEIQNIIARQSENGIDSDLKTNTYFINDNEFYGSETNESVIDYLSRYSRTISASLKSKNLVIDRNYCHFQKKYKFTDFLEQDITLLKSKMDGSYFYYIQEMFKDKNTYGVYIFIRNLKLNIIFYDQKSGIFHYNDNEITKFKEYFNSIISKYGNNYCSIRVRIKNKIKDTLKIKNSINLAQFTAIMNHTANTFINNTNSKKFSFVYGDQKEENEFSKNILKNDKSSVNRLNTLIEKYLQYIISGKEINKNSFIILFIINYLTIDTELAFKKISSFEPQMIGRNEDQEVLVLFSRYYKNTNNLPKPLTYKIFYKILKKISEDILTNIPRTPFHQNLNTFEINESHHNFIKTYFKVFNKDYATTIKDWYRGASIYNDKYISKHLNGSFVPNFTLNQVGKDIHIKEDKVQNTFSIGALRSHIEIATNCPNSKFVDFMLASFNQNNIGSIGHLIIGHFFENKELIINIEHHYTFAKLITNNVYDIIQVLNFDLVQDFNANKKIKFKNPINFAYTFTVELKDNNSTNIKNFNLGFLNHTKNCQYSKDLKEVILGFMKNPAGGSSNGSNNLNLNVIIDS